jgi:peptidoglycan hydrolase-like protein with peptidoglycan-binding domain
MGTCLPMRILVLLLGLLTLFTSAPAGIAQQNSWLQIEAQPTLAGATERARAYATLFPNVEGYQTASGWYAIVLGPMPPDVAAAQLLSLRQDNLIPRDSFLADGSGFGDRFWPAGVDAAGDVAPLAPDATITAEPLDDAAPVVEEPPVIKEPPVIEEPDETPRQARTSEAALSRDERMALQTALQWYGFYTSAIDGAFGPGTRNSMAAWQEANGYEPTGVLTSRQRATLTGNYAADQAEFGFELVTEAESGIEITLPLALVEFDHYEPPFVHYAEKNGSGLRIVLISQPGDASNLAGLYDILQTLEVVPEAGERTLGETSFDIQAVGPEVQSFAHAEAARGQVKGYLMIWRPEDAERMVRILPVLKSSFRSTGDKALDPGLVPMDAAQRRGLLSGLEMKKPLLSRSGFFIDGEGRVLTTAEAVASCGHVTLDRNTDATVSFSDAASGLAVLTPATRLAPPAFAAFASTPARIGGEVTVAGYSYEDSLPAPVLTKGLLEDNAGLSGEADLARITAPVLPGDAGGPVLDATGAVIGLLLPAATDGAKQLPEGVAFVAQAGAIGRTLAGAGIPLTPAPTVGIATPDALSASALGMTVLVSCWE